MSGNSKPTQNGSLSFELTDWLDKTGRLDGAATPGPWETVEGPARRGHITAPVDGPEEGKFITHCEECMGYVLNAANAEWIAHARTALPQAVAALRSVADLHQPRRRVTRSASGHLVDTPGPCTDCDWDWPCPTTTAINETLGEA